jgi:cell division initiation protein
MIELTPLDVRKKKGDFRRGLRGYEQSQVDDFLDVVADRMEILVREAAGVGDRIARLEQQVADYRDREKALTEALVTAQQMREDMRSQSRKEVDLLHRQAEQDAAQIRADAVKAREREEEALRGLRERQLQFMASYRAYLEQEISDISAIARGLGMHASGSQSSSHPAPAVPPVTHAQASPAAAGPSDFASSPAAESPRSQPPHDPVAASPATTAPVMPAPTPAPVATAAPPIAPKSDAGTTHSIAPAATERPEPEAPVEAGGWSPEGYDAETASAPAATHEPVRAEADELDAQLEEALARWEPELEPEENEAAVTPEQDDELILSDDDVINTTSAVEATASADDDGIDDIMDFLDLEDEPVADAAPSPNGRGKGTHEIAESGPEVSTSMSGPADDDDFAALAAIMAEEDEAAEPDNAEIAAIAAESADSNGESVDVEASEGVAQEPSFAEAESEFPDDSEFFHGDAAEGDRRNAGGEFGDPFSERDDESEGKLIDLDSMGALTRYEPSGGSPDTSTLTLHPMFFDQDSPDLPGMLESNGTEKDHDRWS